MISSNIHGKFTAPSGLEPVLRAVEGFVDEGDGAYVYHSRHNGDERLVLSSDTVLFQSTPLEPASRNVFIGGVAGSLMEIKDFVRRLSDSLSAAGIEHRLEVYEGRQEVAVFFG